MNSAGKLQQAHPAVHDQIRAADVEIVAAAAVSKDAYAFVPREARVYGLAQTVVVPDHKQDRRCFKRMKPIRPSLQTADVPIFAIQDCPVV